MPDKFLGSSAQDKFLYILAFFLLCNRMQMVLFEADMYVSVGVQFVVDLLWVLFLAGLQKVSLCPIIFCIGAPQILD